jgi:hypothetical protein
MKKRKKKAKRDKLWNHPLVRAFCDEIVREVNCQRTSGWINRASTSKCFRWMALYRNIRPS